MRKHAGRTASTCGWSVAARAPPGPQPKLPPHAEAENKSPRTVEAYTDAVRFLALYCEAHGKPLLARQLRREHIQDFIADQLARWKPATAHNRYRSLHAFFKWAVAEGDLQASPMDGMKPPNLPEQPVGVIRAEQLVRLLKTCEGRDFPSRRDTAIILLLVQRRGTGLGTALGLAGGALSTAKHYYHEFPVRSTFMRGQPGEIGPGKYGWQFVIREGGGVIGPPVGAKLDPDIPVAPGLHRAHYQGWFIGGGNQAFYTSPRVNTSYMKVFENAARNLAQGGNLQVTTMRGGGRTSLEWSGYTPGGQSMRLGLPDVLDSSLPTLAPTLRAANTRVTPGTTIWVGE